MGWLPAEALFEDEVDEELRIWNRSEIEPHTNRIREWKPRQGDPQPGHPNALKTHCPRGHEYNEANTTYRAKRSGRECRVCRRERRERSG
jgi:hypothetical protein